MAKRSTSTVPPVGPTLPPVPPEDELVLLLDDEDDEDDEDDDEPQLAGEGGAWHLQVSALHHQPP
jgi:hypothetical protein